MRVLLNAVGAQMGGAERHLSSMIGELDRLNSDVEYTVLVRSGLTDFSYLSRVTVQEVPAQQLGNLWQRIAFDRREIPRLLARENFSLCVSLLNFGPARCPCPHVVFQRNALYFDRAQLKRTPLRERLGFLARRSLAVATVHGAKLMVTPSVAMAEQVRACDAALGIKPFAVLQHGFDYDGYDAPLATDISEVLAAATGMRILYPAHLARHKGFGVVVEVANQLRAHGLDFTFLLTIEAKDWPEGFHWLEQKIHRHGLQSHIRNLGTVPQNQMGAVYRATDIVFYPSFCESFGFSLVEALAFGLPIVASDRAVNREICGSGATYYAPDDVVQASSRVFDLEPSTVREKHSLLAKRQFAASDWSWRRYVHEFEGIVRQATEALSIH